MIFYSNIFFLFFKKTKISTLDIQKKMGKENGRLGTQKLANTWAPKVMIYVTTTLVPKRKISFDVL